MRILLTAFLTAVALGATPTAVLAATVTVLAGELPPMMTAEGTGREAAIIRATLEACGHSVRFRVVPFTRHWKSFEAGQGDAVATVPAGLPLPGARTGTYIHYQNGVSYLARTRAATSLTDLAGTVVVAFAGASGIVPGLQEAVPRFRRYREVTNQLLQSRLLFVGRTDYVIGDGLIFAEYNRQLRERVVAGDALGFDPGQPVVFSAIFEPTPYGLVFRDPALAGAFDRCFAALSAQGRVDAINQSFVEPYRSVVGDQYLHY